MRDFCKHFVPGGEEGTPESLLCSGCGCHLSFHEKIVATLKMDVASESFRYGECKKNHGMDTGDYVLDGCGEFMAAGEDGSPESFSCAACGCHRSFHHREYF
ncbi:PREDICTED: mini zinc finger protein 3-like [Tarenaya hassleriana]|uniref:mini zinc finger protein 3-like n=1 Tax=Tarenaya hassleriana TaxID=28532 RepID=UPI00053C4F50|nr:PREDICTED: mini zinc finger protein 3-like [Tarenaya hassleriana]